ncbi:Ribonuclease P protein subunit p25 [Triplophysa tibetana]|uniref:Ribonuclease P protein subunit p25 n=1 Tax=Triplophysa tibetana TaxID=1572043 RepID=A0A5A9PRU4_9TELE|nr:Ribonuclease P protein subunit p25 [Triplophysa tibetana]
MFVPSRELHHENTQSKCTTSVSHVQQPELNVTNPPGSTHHPKQNGFKKICSTGEASPCPIPGLGSGVLEMRVKEGSKIRNLLGFALSRLQADGHKSVTSQVLFSGTGRAMTKTITCAEIMKRKVQGLHQVSKLQYKMVTELRESLESGQTVQMTIHRTVPSICILLSKEPINPLEPGYQPPAEKVSQSKEKNEGDGSQGSGNPEKRPYSPYSHVVLTSIKRAALGQDSFPTKK